MSLSDPDADDEDYTGVDEGDDEDAIMEDEEDDGEGNFQPRTKKPKRDKNAFVDDMAEDEDDPEGLDQEEGPEEEPDQEDMAFIAEDDESAEAEKAARDIMRRDREREKKRNIGKMDDDGYDDDPETMHAALDQQRDAKEAEEVAAIIHSKYGGMDEGMDDEGEGHHGDSLELNESALLPSIKDPRLFLVKCDPGKEHDMILALMNKYNLKENSRDDKLYIHSAFTTPASKGYVYIEADKDVHVKRAIRGLRALKWWKIMIVPIKEMVSAVKFQDDIQTVKPKQWVRMKRGIYNGDLAQVVGLSDQNTVITVKLIPRLDLAAIEKAEREKASGEPQSKKRPRATVRPQAQLFNHNEIQAITTETLSKRDGFYLFGSNRYRHGFLYKDTNIQALTIDGVVPTQDEIDRFQAKLTVDDDEDGQDEPEDEPSRSASGSITTSGIQRNIFSMGDRVIVCEGEMKNITGIVTSIGKNTATITPDRHHNINMSVELTLKQLKKYFRLGDHIKVISGPHKNETGLITQVKESDDSVIFYSDISLKEIKVAAQDVIESSEVSTGQDSLGNYELHDLVQLTGDVVGVIVKVELASFKVLSNRGIVTTVRLQEIGKKRNSRTATALDSQSSAITRDDVVKVLSGPHQGRQGTIIHIYRSSVFIHSRTYMENSGIFVVQAKHVALVGQQNNQKSKVPASPYVGSGQIQPVQPSKPPERGGARAPRGGFGIDPLVMKTVMVVKGQYKGYMGIVREINDTNCRVELHALARIVPIKRDFVKERDQVVQQKSDDRDRYFHAQTPLIGSATPAWGGMGSATPAHPGLESGSMTPAWQGMGSRTPSRSAFAPQTPSHDAWTPVTPGGRTGRNNPRTPSAAENAGDEYEREMQSLGSSTQRTPQPITPRNPHTPSNPITPRADDTYDDDDKQHHTPHTPYTHTPTPHTPGAKYTTPHTPHTPYTPHTPAPQTPGGSTLEEEEEEAPSTPSVGGETLPIGSVVIVRDSAMAARDSWDGYLAYITAVKGHQYQVKPLEGETTRARNVLQSNCKAQQPEKGQTVIVLAGNNQGQVGVLIGIDGTEGLVRANDILMVQMSQLSRYYRPTGR